MSPAVTKSAAAAPPNDPIGAAIEDPDVQTVLLKHALAVLGRRIGGRATPDWLERARDACQETYARALRKRADYNPNFPVPVWLHGILHFVLAESVNSIVRSPSQESAHPEVWEALTAALDSDPAETADFDLASLLAKLPPEHKEMIQLKYCEGLTHAEIAARMGITNGNARVRLSRALLAARTIAGVALQEDRP
jgi:RNA polymerase sigma-70 factor (ECF subfamily)